MAPNIYNFAPLNYFQRPDERYTAGAFADYEISAAIKPYMEFMFMDDRTLAQIAPSGDFGNTLIDQLRQPADERAAARRSFAILTNQVIGFIGNFPVAAGAPYNTPEDGLGTTTPLKFIDPTTGADLSTRSSSFLRRNTEGGPRIADLTHTSYRGVARHARRLSTTRGRTTLTSSTAASIMSRSTRTSSRSARSGSSA